MSYSSHSFAVFLIVAAGVGVVGYSRSVLRDKRRTAALKLLAQERGFVYWRDGHPFDPAAVPKAPLFTKSKKGRFRHVLRGWIAGMQAAVFDYQCMVGSGEDSRFVRQTVAVYRLPHAIANFELAPWSWGARVTAFFGGEDIRFADHPEFSKRYRVEGRDETSVRQFFTPPVLLYFEGLPPHPWNIQTSEGWLIVCYQNRLVSPDAISDFIRETSNFAVGLGQL